jgi:iron(III) transport system substrate-binding protein
MLFKPATRILLDLIVIAAILTGCIPPEGKPTIAPSREVTRTGLNAPVATDVPSPNLLDSYFLPPYYPNSYQKIIDASKNEQGLVIYSILNEKAWAPVIETFNGHYPWIKVTTIDLGASEVFERFNTDTISGERVADLIVSYAPDGWINFANSGHIEPYLSEEDFYIPPWTKLAPGVYTIASDPLVIIYNKKVFSKPPQSMSEIVDLLNANPEDLDERITSYDASQNSTGLAINWFWIDKQGESGWKILNRIGESNPSLKTSASSMVSSILNGESSLGYFVSPISFLPELDQHPDLGWTYIRDGQPILMRSVAITRLAPSPNSAKLMVDFLLSQEGQLALAMEGMTPFRPDIANVDIFNTTEGSHKYIHFNQVIEEVGLDNLIFITLDPELINPDKQGAFIERWNTAFGK